MDTFYALNLNLYLISNLTIKLQFTYTCNRIYRYVIYATANKFQDRLCFSVLNTIVSFYFLMY